MTMVWMLILPTIADYESTVDSGNSGSFLFSAAAESRDEDDNYRMLVIPDNPQPNGDHWSVYVIIEEKEGDIWNKTTQNITVKLIRYVDTQEEVVLEEHGTDGLGFVVLDLSYELSEGNYTVRGIVDEVQMDWKKEALSIPLTSRPPFAVAKLVIDDLRVKETTLTLDRQHEASIILDGSESWDPDEGETELINFTWTIGDTKVTINKTSLLWTFTEPGDYNITLKAEDPSEWNMYSEDWVLVHVVEIEYKPDLRITIEPDKTELELGESIHLTALVGNTGNNDAWGFDVYFYDIEGIFTFKNIGLIPMGMNRTIAITYTPIRVGQDKIIATVDPVDDVEEWDEQNNEASFDIDVLPTEQPVMEIETLNTTGSHHTAKTTYITIVVRNNGKADAHNVLAYLHINGKLLLNQSFETVAAGDQYTVVYSWIPEVKGLYTAHIEIWVDIEIHDSQYLTDLQITDPPNDPNGGDDNITFIVIASSGGILILCLAMVGYYGVENTKYKLLGSMLMFPLYTRLKKEDTLNHAVRARVYKHITAHPGDSYASILKALELKNGTLVHHLRTLERERYVKSKKDGKFKRFYPWGTKVGERDPNYLTDIQIEIVDIIKESPGVSQAHIASDLHRSRQSINYQIKVLSEAGLINVIKHGITTRCYVKET